MNESPEHPGEGEHPDDERLLAALRELTGRTTRKEAAALLGVSVRTLIRAVSEKRLTPRMRDTLTLRLTADGGRDGDGDEAASRAPSPGAGELEGRVARLDACVQALEETVDADRGAASTAASGATDGRKVRAGEPGPDTSSPVAPMRAAAPPPVPGVEQPVIGRRPAVKPRRPFPELVTLEAEEGEKLVYGKAAPLVAEWRRVRAGHLNARMSRVEQATDWVRMCELELALIGEHGLTLPPDSYPWDRFQRRDALRRRELWLDYARAERRRALCWRFLRRVLTFGLRRR